MRRVYEHAAFPSLLIKVFRPSRMTSGGDLVSYREKGRLKLRRRLGAHRITAREIAEHLAFQTRYPAARHEQPFAAVVGLLDTDQGVGLIVEKITDETGHLAPTLKTLLKSGRFSVEHRNALATFFQALERWHVCVGDLNTSNIVLRIDADGSPRFVAVDGLGLRSAIPVQDWFRWINAMQVRKRARRVWKEVWATVGGQAARPVSHGLNDLNALPSASLTKP